MKKIIGIDFDGTCVTDLYPYVGDNIGAASVLRKLADKNLLILYTVSIKSSCQIPIKRNSVSRDIIM
jgi:hypothetical protein